MKSAATFAICLLSAAFCSPAAWGQEDEDTDKTLPGVVARYTTENVAVGVEAIEPVPRLVSLAGQSPRLGIAAGQYQVVWTGLLQVPFAGEYTLTARRQTLSSFAILIDGKPVQLGTPVELPQGPVALRVSGRQAAGDAALELWWRSQYFADEPIEARHFRHDPATLIGTATADRLLVDRGAVLAETHGCFRCHTGPQAWSESLAAELTAAQTLPGPNLDNLAERVNPAWLVEWLKNPHQLRSGTSMPRLFADSPADELAARTIAAYLLSSAAAGEKTPAQVSITSKAADAAQGEASFKAMGCAACHAPPASAATSAELVSAAPALDKLAEKWTSPGLAKFLQKPLDSRAHGRMPDFSLSADEAANLAAYLLSKPDAGKPAAATTALAISDADLAAQWRTLNGPDAAALAGSPSDRLAAVAVGQMSARSCFNCHEAPTGKLATIERQRTGSPKIQFTLAKLDKIKPVDPPALRGLNKEQLGRGCLGPQGASKAALAFSFSPADRAALVTYCQLLDEKLAASTADRLRVDMAVLNCVRCHENESQGGESLAALLGGDDHSKYYRPPMLTRVGERLRPERLLEWIGQGARAKALRPWVGARMPGFGGRATRISAALSARDGSAGPAALAGAQAPIVTAPAIQTEHLQTGRFLVGTKALACINCHTLGGKLLAGQPDATTRGPDLTLVAEHLRPEYFQRWVMNPARIRPGTKMPQAIQPNGTVAIASLKALPPGGAMNALWSYLSQGTAAPAPADEPTVLVLPQVGQPAVQRGEVNVGAAGKFPRAVNLGFADGTLLFDADQLTTVAAWYGSFIKPASSPYFGLWWSREGAEPDVFITKTHPLSFELVDSQQPQKFALPLESDPNVGTRFEGHQVGKSSVRLKYRLLVGGQKVQVTEDVRLESRPEWEGFAREFSFSGLPAGVRVSLALPTGGEAQAYAASGTPALTFKVKVQSFAAITSAASGAKFTVADKAEAGKANAADRPAGSVASAVSREKTPVLLRVDLWRYRGKNPAPTAGELDYLIATPSALDDDFARPVAPPAPVASAQVIDTASETAKPQARTRPAINPQENIDEFSPVSARFVRFKVLRTSGNEGPGIDELEIYGTDPKVNLALAGKASASSVIAGYPIHQIPHLNDGKLSNNFSWIGSEAGKGWVMVELPQAAEVRKVVWARDRTGVCKDRLAVGYQVEVSDDGVNFRKVSDDSDRILTAGAGVVNADATPGYFMQSLDLPFPECRMSDIAFADDGTMYALAMTEGQVWRTKTPPADRPAQIRWQRFASGLYHPIGMQIVDGRIFVAQKPEITELIDRDGDGTADEFRTLASGWGLSTGWHEYTFGLAVDPQKNLWFALNTGYFWTNPGYVNPGKWRGSVMRLSYEADKLEEIAKGCRVPNGIVCGTDDQIFYTDNQGDWIQSCKLAHVVPGRFYGHPEYKEDALAKDTYPDGRSAVWMPYNNSRSTSGPVCDKSGGKFGPFGQQMFLGDVGYGGNPGIMRIALEKVDGEYQGAVLKFIDGQPLGCERMKFGPDNQLYMASLTTGLTRLKYQGETPLAIERVNIRPAGAGFVIHLTRPLAANTQLKPADFRVRRYHYLYTGNYGSPEADVAAVSVAAAELASDRMSITLTFPVETYPIGMVYEINAGKLTDDAGHTLLHNEAWYTVHRIPK